MGEKVDQIDMSNVPQPSTEGTNVHILQNGQGEGAPPQVKCPWCGEINLLDLMYFNKSMGAPIRTKCRSCGGDVYVCILILANNTLPKLMNLLKLIITTVDEAVRGNRSSLILPKGMKRR